MIAEPAIPVCRHKKLPLQPVAQRSVELNAERDVPSLKSLVKKSHVPGKSRKQVGVNQHTDHHEKNPCDNFENADVFFEAVENDQETMHGKSGKKERDPKSKRIE